jgi:methionyl-tRNA formyltransferase
MSEVDVGISYGFGLKFSKEVIDCFSYGLINIHTGDLPNYRSRHPISWAMIKGENKIGVTIHKVDEKFDCGFLVHKYYVDRLFLDDLHTIESKIESALVDEFPIAVKKLVNGNFSKLKEGTYLNRIDRTFSSVDPSEMQSKQLFSLFRSQKVYGGVNILGKKKMECHIYNEAFDSHYHGYQLFKCIDDILVAIK